VRFKDKTFSLSLWLRLLPTDAGLFLMRIGLRAVGRQLFGLGAPKCEDCGAILETERQAARGICHLCKGFDIWFMDVLKDPKRGIVVGDDDEND